MSNIKTRLLEHFASGNTLSVRNMYLVNITNPAREVVRNFELVYNIPVERKRIDWKHNGSSGYFFEYSLSRDNREKAVKLAKSLRNNE
jgi:hypothetical protein